MPVVEKKGVALSYTLIIVLMLLKKKGEQVVEQNIKINITT